MMMYCFFLFQQSEFFYRLNNTYKTQIIQLNQTIEQSMKYLP